MKKLVEYVERQHLSYNMQLLCDTFGIVIVREMIHQCPSTQIYIPSAQKLAGAVYDAVKDNKTKTVRELSKGFNLSEPHIYKVLAEIKNDGRR